MTDSRKKDKYKRKELNLKRRGPLVTDDRPGMVTRFVNTWDGSYDEKLAMGYRVVTKDHKSDDTKDKTDPFASAVTRTTRLGRKVVLMEIPEETYNAYRKERAEVARREAEDLEPVNSGDFYGSLSDKVKK